MSAAHDMPSLAIRPRLRPALLHGVSLTALLVAGSAGQQARAAPFRSLNQALALAGHAAQAAVSPANGVVASKQAALGVQNLARGAGQFRSLAAALAAARAAPQGGGSPIVVDGYGAGRGLQAANGAASGNALWQGALTPDDPANAGGIAATPAGVAVTVKQTAPLARLTWRSFNVGAHTTLKFDQSSGGTLASSWVAINSVQDPTANPSEILGAIQAQGKVYILDRNGIAFGAGSTVNVGSLIAATADIADKTQFTTTAAGQNFDLYGAQATSTSKLTGLTTYFNPTFNNGSAAAITVDPGASIQTAGASGTSSGGYVMLLGGNVSNAGLIGTPQGQTILAAGTDFTLRQGFSGSVTAGNTTSTTLGSEIATTNVRSADGSYATGSVANSGIVVSDQGDISLVGHALNQSGVLLSTTTVNQRGTIHFLTPNDGTDLASSITLAPNSLTEVLPEDNGATQLDSARQANVANSAILNALRIPSFEVGSPGIKPNAQLNNHDILADQLGESRVEISTAGAVDVGAGALVQAPGGQVAIGGGSQVVLEQGATLDVSGSTNAVLPASMNSLLVNVQPFQLRDAASSRTGPLKGTNVYVDERTLVEIASGAYAGNIYTPGGLIEVGGFIGQVPHGISELTAIGGQVTLQAVQNVINPKPNSPILAIPGAVITQPGSVINLQGGTVTYASGQVKRTYVQATDGTIYNINTAPANLTYTGVYDGFEVQHPRWHVNEFFGSPLLEPSTVTDPSYTLGRDAGGLTVNAATAVLQGAVYAGVTDGNGQTGPRPASVIDPYLLAQTVVPQAGSLAIGNYIAGALQPAVNPSTVVFQSTQGPSVSGAGTLAPPVLNTITIDAPMLTADGFANVTVSTSGSLTVASPISVADGGSVSLTGGTITVESSITARSGSITLTDQILPAGQGVSAPVAPKTSITLAPNAVLDARGVWTNGQIDPVHVAGLSHAAGGTVSVVGSRAVDLAAGSRIDVSSGGGILAGGKTLSAAGGSVNVVADVQLPPTGSGAAHEDPVTLDAAFVGYGSKGGGTLSLVAPVFDIGGPAGAPPQNFLTVNLGSALFSSGFSKYVVNGTAALNVLPGAQITAAEPIYVPNAGLAVPTGGDPSAAYSVVLPALYTPARGSDVLTERQGASISLLSAIDPNHQSSNPVPGGPLTIGAGASVAVDPGQSITVAAYDQVTVLGTLTAHSGAINVANTRFDPETGVADKQNLVPSEFQAGVSVWLGDGSLLDVSGQAVVQTDPVGRRFGLAGSGGAIATGGYNVVGAAQSTWAQVIVRPGATLDADGAQATVDVVPGAFAGSFQPQSHMVTLAGAGGSISARSLSGVALDGTLSARSGDGLAAGGSLTVQIDPTQLPAYNNIPTGVFQPRQVLVSEATVQVQPNGLQPGDAPPPNTYGLARVSQQQISAGGFDAITLVAQGGGVVFDGNVSLAAGRSIALSTGIIGDNSPNDSVRIAAPHVTFTGYTQAIDGSSGNLAPNPPGVASFSTLTVQSALIDIGNILDFGGTETVTNLAVLFAGPNSHGFGAPLTPVVTSSYSFEQANFDSTGDIRFLGYRGPAAGTGQLINFGNIAFTAAQLYPVTAASAQVVAGYDPHSSAKSPISSEGTITVSGLGGAAPPAPYSVGGSLTLLASNIVQGGIIRAPEGNIDLTESVTTSAVVASQITLAPGSITSVSLEGQEIPYGGTVDGVNYSVPGGGTVPIFTPLVQLQAQSIDIQDGASIDLRGGGTLTGAGFVFGRGGTADVLTTPLLNTTGGTAVANAQAQVAAIQPVNTGDPVYAILPGYGSAYAPAPGPGDAGYTATQAGQQITVGSGIAGLAAGTYTLLPAYYALLPGAYRVELTSGNLPANTSITNGDFTSIAPVTLSTANTGIVSPVSTAALFTSGTNVRQLSQYNEESYNAFEAATATQFGGPRPFLPQDAKTLLLSYPSVIGTLSPLSFAPSALLKTPAPGGYGATLEVDVVSRDVGPRPALDIVGPGYVGYSESVVIPASTLSALDVPRLVLGGTLTASTNSTDVIDVVGNANLVYLAPQAVLTAGEVLITTTGGGFITVASGATISTIGAGPTAYDAASGYVFNTDFFTSPVLDVSQGRVNFLPNASTSSSALITISDGSALLAGGSLDIVAPLGTNVSIGNVTLAAKYASISVAAVNIGEQISLNALQGQLPSGIAFTPEALSGLLNGNAALGRPAATELTLTATQEVNILGSVQLDTGTTNLVLNTPAIYGVGSSGDTATINTAGFTWNGVGAVSPGNLLLNVSATPGGQLMAGSAGQSGALQIQSSGAITLGYGPQTQANDQLQLDRLVSGFGTVTLQSATEITANNKSSLSVYASQPAYGQPGTGGNLSLLAPLITTAPASVLKLTAGGSLALSTPPKAVPAPTTGVTSLGGEIDLSAPDVTFATAVALPSGQLNVTAANAIDIQSGAHLDLTGRTVHLFDQTVYSPGGSLSLEATSGSIGLSAGSLVDVSATGAGAGSVSLKALAGDVNLDGALLGAAVSGQTAGTFSVVAGTLSTGAAANAGDVFGTINAALDTGVFYGSRRFETGLLANGPGAGASSTTDIVIGNAADGTALLAAHAISVTADLGSIDVIGTVNASGTSVGSIALNAHGNLTLEAGAVLDAHGTVLAADSTGAPIDAENRAHVTLTSTAGSLLLNGGTVNLSSPDPVAQGQFVLNAQRVGTNDVAIAASAPISVLGAQSIALYAWRTYSPTDANGTIEQGSPFQPVPVNAVTLTAIDTDNTAFMNAAGANGALAARLAGLSGYGASFHLRPGVEIDSSALSKGNLTISGDLDLSGLRYSDAGYGAAVTPGIAGSGEAGSIVFRAANDLVVNGSVTDGFAPPPDKTPKNYLASDAGWVLASHTGDQLGADVLLPSTIAVPTKNGRSINEVVELGKGTEIPEGRPVSLNYDITIHGANVDAGTVIPFAAGIETLDFAGNAQPVTIPSGGFVTTASITPPTGAAIPAGSFLPGGTVIPIGSTIAAGSVLPVAVQVVGIGGPKTGLVIPAGTLLTTFNDPVNFQGLVVLTLSASTVPLPDNAFLPSGTKPNFVSTDGKTIPVIDLRPAEKLHGDSVQGYLYALSAMLPAGSQSWNLDFVSGANLASPDRNAVLPRSQLDAVPGSPPTNIYDAPGSLILDDEHQLLDQVKHRLTGPAFSVIRTGTGDLSLVAGGNIDQSSLYGIYTAGTQDSLPGGAAANASYDLARQGYKGSDLFKPGPSTDTINRIVQRTYQAYYPNNGGDVLVQAGGNLTGDLYGGGQNRAGFLPSDAVGNWLWRQGSTQIGQPTAWWINFGTFAPYWSAGDNILALSTPGLVGFQGIGALGGGNVSVAAEGDAGQITGRLDGLATTSFVRGEGLVVAAASTGRVISSNGTSTTISTGGGSLTLNIKGSLNPLDYLGFGVADTSNTPATLVNGSLIDPRGNISVVAGAIGRLDTQFSTSANATAPDPRPTDPYVATYIPNGGITVVPGDGVARLVTMRDLALDGAADATRVTEQNLTLITPAQAGTATNHGGATGFTLWTPYTGIDLFSSGGNVAPVVTGQIQQVVLNDAATTLVNDGATDGRIVYPSRLFVTAAQGNIAYGDIGGNTTNYAALEIAPSSREQVSFLAGSSIEATNFAIDLSGADPQQLSTPNNPAFTSDAENLALSTTNIRPGAGTTQSPLALFALAPDTPTTSYLDAQTAAQPALFYAASGDILNFTTGETLTFAAGTETLTNWYLAAKPVRIIAGQDIVNSGTRPSAAPGSLQQNQQTEGLATVSGDLFLNTTPQSISVVSAGRDILSGYFYVGGPGLLEVDAGRNIQQIGFVNGSTQLLAYGSIKSLGSLLSGAPISLTGGAGITVQAGLGSGADYTAFADLYFNPANQANLALQITDPANAGKVQQVYSAQLLAWLQANYGYTGDQAGALAYFLDAANVPVASQQAFLRDVFYAELLASGQQYNNAASRFAGSYARGRQAIGTLLPGQNGQTTPATGAQAGVPQGYAGAITMSSGTLTAGPGPTLFDAGVATEHGGDIQVLVPGGEVVLGTSGSQAPGGGTGLITNGFGNIDVFAKDSVLLGKSRIFTNAGGNIQIWSAEGDINAGIGARTSLVFNPPVISYDNTGGLVESPAVPTSGAGIATQQPLPSVPAGNIDLTAPQGTIDAGEAGVRSSGNINLAALHLANTAGIVAQGKTTGITAVPTISASVAAAAGAAAGAAANAAQETLHPRTQPLQEASLIEVEVISISGPTTEDQRRRRAHP